MSFCRWYLRLLERIFAFTGRVIATHPWLTIGLCLLTVGICSIGFCRYKAENRTDKLFVPQDSEAIKDLDKAEQYFQLKVREETVLLEAVSEGNVLTPDCLKEALKIHREIINLDSYGDLCITASGKKTNSSDSCFFINPLEVIDLKNATPASIAQQVNKAYSNPRMLMRNRRPLVYNYLRLFGGVTKNSSTGEIIGARAVQMIYQMRDPTDNDDVIEWEKTFIAKVSSMRDDLTCGKVHFSAERSMDDAISESTKSDILLVSITFTLMITFACTMLGKFKNPLIGHSLLANAGVFAVVLGILSGFGLSMLVGVPFVSMVGILPFLVLGVGIDDMFIIVDELDRHKPQDVVESVKVVMSRSGATITMTTLTDLVAFAVSTSSSFPAIKYFCIYAALSVTLAYLMMISFFVAVMAFDVRRIKRGRRDCLPVCRAPLPKEGALAWDEPQRGTSSKMMVSWGKFLMLPGTKVAVIFLSLGLIGAGVYGATKIDKRFDRRMLAKDDSYFIEFLNAQDRYFNLTIEVSIVLTEPLDYGEKSNQMEILKLSEIVVNNEHYVNKTVSWLEMFVEFAEQISLSIDSQENFMSALRTFLELPGFSLFREDVILSEDQQHIAASRIAVFMKSSTDSSFQRDAMLSLRQDLSTKSELPVFPISRWFVFFEQYVAIPSATIRNLVIAAVAILVLTSPFLVDITVTLLVSVSFVALILELLCLMYVWGVSLNSVSLINLVMAIGFSVDYSAHIAHAFVMSQETTANDRVIEALGTLGSSVFMGGKKIKSQIRDVGGRGLFRAKSCS